MNNAHKRKRLSTRLEYEDFNKVCFEWFQKRRSMHIPISRAMIRAQALNYALGLTYFRASVGWLDSFKCRHNISQYVC